MSLQDDWKTELENQLMTKARRAARQVNPKVLGAELDLHNGVIHVITSEMLPHRDQVKIRNRVLESIREKFASEGHQSLRVWIRPPHTYPYTLHAVPVGSVVKLLPHPEQIREVSVKMAELRSLRQAYEQLRGYAEKMDYVVTCARGGVPAMNYIAGVEFEKNHEVEDDEKLAALKAKHNVFPGLSWDTPTLEARESLSKWLNSLEPGSSLLFFDTGRMGNGARAFFSFLIDEYLPNAPAVQVSDFCIFGVVTEPTQKVEIREVETRHTAKVVVRIDYIRVDRVVTEDVEVLLGYQLLVHEETLQPVSAGTRITLVDDAGNNQVTLGTTAAARIFSSWLRTEPNPEPNNAAVVPSSEAQVTAADVLFAAAYNYEKTEIQVAAACGLVKEEIAQLLLKAVGKKYRGLAKPPLRMT